VAELCLTSARLPVPHGFTTRAGGISKGPYTSLNLGGAGGDDPAHVAENLRRVAGDAGVSPGALRTVAQVHGRAVLAAPPPEEGEQVPVPFGEADALWTDRPQTAVGVRTADCVPLLLVDPVGRRVAAVHSGWRGTDQKVAASAVEALVAEGSRPQDLLAAIGPCIQVCCYRVSEELAERFALAFGDEVVERVGGEARLDLPRAVRRTLEGSGLRADQLDVMPYCTACDPLTFFSHRRDQGVTGRHLAYVVCRFPAQGGG
jgi:polyphenol oxidase